MSALTLDGVEYQVDTLMRMQVGPGTWYMSLRMTTASGKNPHNVFFLHVDATNSYISFESVLAKDSLTGTERPSAMAKRKTTAGHHLFGGVNADFFTTGTTSIAEGTACYLYGRPSGGVFVDHEVTTLQSNRRQSFVVDDNNNPYIGAITRQMVATVCGEDLSIYNINYSRSAGKLTLFNHWNGARSTACTPGTEVLLRPATGEYWRVNHTTACVVEVVEQNNGGMAIPADKVVLSGSGEMATKLNALQAGDTVRIQMNMLIGGQAIDIAHGVGGPDATKYAQMLRDGVVVSDSIWASNEPRTGIGYSQNRDTIIFCVCDGRSNTSTGVSTYVEGEIMKAYGAWDALNVDGGGSSCLYLEPFGGPMNETSDGSERAVGDAFFAVYTAPEDATLARIACYTPEIRIPQYGCATFQFAAYNQYDVLLDTDAKGVQLTCDPQVGYFLDGGEFVALGDGLITATKDGITTQIQVYTAQDAVPMFRLDSVLLNRASEYEAEVLSTAGNQTIRVLARSLSWTVEDPTILQVDEMGVMRPQKHGTTHVYGSIGLFTDTMLVKCHVVPNPYLTDSLASLSRGAWTIKGSSTSWNPQCELNEEGFPMLTMNYKSTRQGNLKLTPKQPLILTSSPDYIELRMSSTDFPVSNIKIGLTSADGRSLVYNVDTTHVQGEMRLVIDIDRLYGVTREYAMFPMHIDYLTFYMDTSAPASDCALLLNGLYLYYGEYAEDQPEELLYIDGTDVRKVLQDGQIMIRKGADVYTLTGTKIQ